MTTELPMTTLAAYEDMRAHGCRFEIEILQTGMVHVTISSADDDLDSALINNGPQVQEAMTKMLHEQSWRRESK
jgi:hypothetical protein